MAQKNERVYQKMKKLSLTVSTLFLASVLSVPLTADANEGTEEPLPQFEVADDDISTSSIPSDPRTILNEPSDGGNWIGPSSASNPSSTGDVQTDQSTASAVLAGLTAKIPYVNALTTGGGIVLAIYNANTPNTYYEQFSYYSDGATGPQLHQATVTYFYTESTRDADSYVGRTSGYSTMTESVPEPE
ncbi:hypothetical protein DH09_00860 (plasmid) [Bacillaceae bacterium JMAK1]|nr:hypothetical protein DH09_00860 [Bacillaceae bacterium JMAK1]